MANSTPDTPDVSATKLAALKMDELRTHARKLGIDGADELHKPELLAKVKDHHAADRSPSASELSSMKLGELREHARKLGIDGADELHKPELLAKVKDHHAADRGDGGASSAKKHRNGNNTPGTPGDNETAPDATSLDKQQDHAREPDVEGADEPAKPEPLARVTDRPNSAEDGHLSHQEEPPGLGYAATTRRTAGETARTAGTTGTAATTGTDATTGTADYDAGRGNAGSTTNDAITRSLGRGDVGAKAREAGRARLPEHVVSEHQHVSAPVFNEEVNLDREPTVEAHRSVAYDGPAIPVGKPEVVLCDERPVVDIGVVPEKPVRLGAETHTEQKTVGGELRNEETEVDADSPNVRGR